MSMSDNFFVNYQTLCNETKARVKVRSLVQKKCLDFNADRFEEEDFIPLTKALKCDRELHVLAIRSEYPIKYRKNCEDNTKPAFHKLTVLNELIESVATCMKYSQMLTTIELQGLPITRSHIETLANGIRSCTSLQNLVLTGCMVNNAMDLIYECVYSHIGLKAVDLTGCGLSSQGAQSVAKIIRTQRLTRYDNMWRHSLRYRKPEPKIFPGISSITLNDNPNIGDIGYLAIVHELSDDLWVQNIKAENCGLTSMSATRSVELLKMNDTIRVLDLNRNNKIVPALQQRIKQLLRERELQKPKEVHNKLNDERKPPRLSKKSNSDLSLDSERNQRETPSLDRSNSLFNNVKFHATKKKLENTKQNLLKEQEKNEKLENQKRILEKKNLKYWNKNKYIEKERNKLRNELIRIHSGGDSPKLKQAKSSSATNLCSSSAMNLSKRGKSKKQKFAVNDLAKRTKQNSSKPTKSDKNIVKTVQKNRVELSPHLETRSYYDNDENTNYVSSDIQTMKNDLNPISRSMSILNGLLNNISKNN